MWSVVSVLAVVLVCLVNDQGVCGEQNYRKGKAKDTHTCNYVRKIPDSMLGADMNRPDGLNKTFYKKYTEAYGIPVFGSDKISDDALKRACYTVRYLFAGHSGVRAAFYKLGGRFAIMAEKEVTLDVPEHSTMASSWNSRARGLGGTLSKPLTTGAEENLLCKSTDRYKSEDIFLHEAAHAVDLIAARIAIPGFYADKEAAFANAKAKGLWKNTYAMTNSVEYFAEGVQSYFNVNSEGKKGGDGIHNEIDTRTELKNYDPTLYKLIEQVFPCDNSYLKRCDSTRAKEHAQTLKMNCNTADKDMPENLSNPSCPDSRPIDCLVWMIGGECQRNAGYMNANCKASCRVCPKPPADCVDKNTNCEGWADAGECDSNPNYMHPNCKWSCGKCYE